MGAFDWFTRKYALSKTLRFELKPVGKTRENLDEQELLTKDENRDIAYGLIKPIFDRLHEEFILESLKGSDIPWTYIAALYREYFSAGKDRKEKMIGKWGEITKEQESLRKAIGQLFDKQANIWKYQMDPESKILKENGYRILTEAGILKILKLKYQNPDENASSFLLKLGMSSETAVETIDQFDKFFTYFRGFNENRENYYSTEEKSTAVSNRIVHENFPKFISNVLAYESRKAEYDDMRAFLSERNVVLVRKDGSSIKAIDPTVFDVDSFNLHLGQSGIDEYNLIIGDINFLVSHYNQQKSEDAEYKKLPQFRTLFKQIGCGEQRAFEILSFSGIDEIRSLLIETFFKKTDIVNSSILTLARSIKAKDELALRQIYFSKQAINSISSRYFSNWHSVSDQLKKANVWKADKKEWLIKISEFTSLYDIFRALDASEERPEFLFKARSDQDRSELARLSKKHSEIFIERFLEELATVVDGCGTARRELESVLSDFDVSNEDHKRKLKSFCDEARNVVMMLKYFLAKKIDSEGIDADFYNGLHEILENYPIFDWYDAIRNFVTKKVEASDKMKLNFENATLAAGWDVNNEGANSCVILRDSDKNEYLAIMSKGNGKSFDKSKNPSLYISNGAENWEKMEYDFWSDVSKMIPKCSTQLKAVEKHFKSTDADYILSGKVASGETFLNEVVITKEVFALNNRVFNKNDVTQSEWRYNMPKSEEVNYIKCFQKAYVTLWGDEFEYKRSLQLWIDFCKTFLASYPKTMSFTYRFRKTEDYASLDEFYQDIDVNSYRLSFLPINKIVLDEMVQSGKVFLFQIKNKDYGPKKTGASNLHTTYWQSAFQDVENRPKLNGEAEIFYRKANEKPTYKKNEDGTNLVYKTTGNPVVDKKRFSEEKFLFHVPLTLNFCHKNERINDHVRQHVASNFSDMRIIGIDRWEKHLAYYSIVDLEGKIIEQGSLNYDKQGQDYGAKLDEKAKDRDGARRSWQNIGTIKELKEGYVSQAVRTIADLAIEHHAMIVLEDLNTGFKRGRQKIEKSVYQKFELALAKKLNFLVDKSKLAGEVGSVTDAIQLTPPINHYGDIEARKQVGIMLYTRANYTSQTDPLTGWRKSVYLKRGSEDAIHDQIISSFKEIWFDGKDYYFEYANSSNKKTWRLYSGVNGKSLDRFHGKRNDAWIWEIEKIDIVGILDRAFVDFDKNRSLLLQIEERVPLKKFGEHTAWESLRFAIDAIMQIRNTGIREDESDFLLSPVRNDDGTHFDSREWLKKNKGSEIPNKLELPLSGDANGAYNIARKGVVMLEHMLRDYESLFVSDEEWDAYLAGPKVWEEWMEKNLKKTKKRAA